MWRAAGWWALCGMPLWAHAGCPGWPAPQVDVVANGYYTDARHSEVSAPLQAQNRESTAAGRRFLAEVSRRADHFHGRDDRAAADCALDGLMTWAEGGALLGQMLGPQRGQQAHYERKWLLAGLALAYLKLKPAASEAQRSAIEPWLGRVADAVSGFWEDKPGQPTRHKRNNHYTWAGLALAATAMAQGDAARWAGARRVFMDTLAEIDAQGRLPMEMARGTRALHYHAYTAGPLVVMAMLSRSRGDDWLAQGDAQLRLARLVDTILQGLAAPAAFAAEHPQGRAAPSPPPAGVKETWGGPAFPWEPQEMPSPSTLAWLALWQKQDRQPERITPWLATVPSVPTLGGDLSLMARRPW
jgi:poly(beta-D-mannuronate) lyase